MSYFHQVDGGRNYNKATYMAVCVYTHLCVYTCIYECVYILHCLAQTIYTLINHPTSNDSIRVYLMKAFKLFKRYCFKVSIITYSHHFKFEAIPIKDKDGKLLHLLELLATHTWIWFTTCYNS